MIDGNTVEAEKKFGASFSFRNTAKFFFSANRLPEITDDTTGWWRKFFFLIIDKKLPDTVNMDLVMQEFVGETPELLNSLIFAVLPNMFGKDKFTFAINPEITKKTYENVSNTSIRFAEEN